MSDNFIDRPGRQEQNCRVPIAFAGKRAGQR
jgi:hypothetical protein